MMMFQNVMVCFKSDRLLVVSNFNPPSFVAKVIRFFYKTDPRCLLRGISFTLAIYIKYYHPKEGSGHSAQPPVSAAPHSLTSRAFASVRPRDQLRRTTRCLYL